MRIVFDPGTSLGQVAAVKLLRDVFEQVRALVRPVFQADEDGDVFTGQLAVEGLKDEMLQERRFAGTGFAEHRQPFLFPRDVDPVFGFEDGAEASGVPLELFFQVFERAGEADMRGADNECRLNVDLSAFLVSVSLPFSENVMIARCSCATSGAIEMERRYFRKAAFASCSPSTICSTRLSPGAQGEYPTS